MLASIRAMLGEKTAQFYKDRDFLEAVLAAAALIAIADGEIEEAEEEAMLKAVRANAILSSSWSVVEITQMAQQMLERAKGGRMGQAGLYAEIEDVAKSPEKAEAVLLMALDVSESDGQIEPEEKVVLEKIGKRLGLNVDSYL